MPAGRVLSRASAPALQVTGVRKTKGFTHHSFDIRHKLSSDLPQPDMRVAPRNLSN